MKGLFYVFLTFIFLDFIALVNGDICGEGKIIISGLGKCKLIIDILQNRDLNLKKQNLLYLASNNEGKIEKDGYKLEIYKLNDEKLQSHNIRKSKLYIPNSCLKQMEKPEHFGLDRNKAIVIMVYDANNLNDNNITDNYFIILHIGSDGTTKYITSKTDDFSFCNQDPILFEDEVNIEDLRYNYNDTTPINVTKILYGRKFRIDLFDRYSDFLSDICFKFTNEKGNDVTLESRVEDYYQNISFCDDRENSHYLSYNYSEDKNTFTYRCAFGFYQDETHKSSYIDKIDIELKSLVAVSNLKVITCYKQFLNLKDIIKNYGGMICILVLIIQIICFLLFCFLGIKPIQEKVKSLLKLGNEIIRRLSRVGIHIDIEKDHDKGKDKPIVQINKKKFNLWGQIVKEIKKLKTLRIKVKNKEIEEIKLNVSNPPKTINFTSRRNSRNKESEVMNIKIMDLNKEEIFNDKQEDTKRANNKRSNTCVLREKGDKNSEKSGHTNFSQVSNSSKIKKSIKRIVSDKKSENSQIYEYEGDELNELSFDKAIKYDKRNFCQFYGNILLISHIILNVFFRYNDYNLFTVKLGLLLMTFPINLTFELFFFTNENIELIYIRSMNDLSIFWESFVDSIYSSILSNILLIILSFIADTHSMVKDLRKISDINEAKDKAHCILRCIKIRIFVYYILSFAFLIVFGFYVLSFCAIFENTQVELIKSSFTSWLISLIYPFIICLITSSFRTLALNFKSKCLYFVQNMLQFL